MKMPFFAFRMMFLLLVLIINFSILGAGQCQATTKKGSQCKRNSQSGSIYCWQHEKMYGDSKKESTKPAQKAESTIPSKKPAEIKPKNENISSQCAAITKKGTRCKRTAKSGSSYCWQHEK